MPPAKKRASAAKTSTPAKKSTPAKRPGPRKMTAAHKSALAEGREQSRVVDRYLRAVGQPKQRGRKVTKDSLAQRLAAAEARAKESAGVDRVLATQEVRDLRARLDALTTGDTTDVAALERDFVKVAKSFSDKRGISYGAWRDAGVPADVLTKARIKRTRG